MNKIDMGGLNNYENWPQNSDLCIIIDFKYDLYIYEPLFLTVLFLRYAWPFLCPD